MNLGHRLAVIERDDARREVALLRSENAALRELLDIHVLDLTRKESAQDAPALDRPLAFADPGGRGGRR